MAELEHRISYDECDLRSLPNRVFSLWLVPTRSYNVVPEKRAKAAWKLREAIEAQTYKDPLAQLEASATFGNQSAFLQELKSIAWPDQSAADFIRALDMCLRMGAHLAARELAYAGARTHPDSEELQKYSRILAAPTVSNRRPSTNTRPKANVEWLKTNREAYKGKWVAIKDGSLIASANSLDELIAEIGETKRRGILVTNLY